MQVFNYIIEYKYQFNKFDIQNIYAFRTLGIFNQSNGSCYLGRERGSGIGISPTTGLGFTA